MDGCLLMNLDRTARNTNMLLWQKELWLIDHDAALYFHHNDTPALRAAENPFRFIKDHVLLPKVTKLTAADAECRALLTAERLEFLLAHVPDEWLTTAGAATATEGRVMYRQFFSEPHHPFPQCGDPCGAPRGMGRVFQCRCHCVQQRTEIPPGKDSHPHRQVTGLLCPVGLPGSAGTP